MIGTDENRAVLYVEAIFWSGKRKTPPSLMSGNIVPILSSKEPRNIWGYAFWTEPSVHLTPIINCWTRCTRTNTIPISWWIR